MRDPKTDINDTQPSSLREIIGQPSVVAQVQVALDAARIDERKFDDALLTGAPGLGKSQLAKVIAAEVGTNLHEVLGQSIECSADLNAVPPRCTRP